MVPPRAGAASPLRSSTKMARAGTRSPFVSKDKFASKEGDDERDPDEDIAAAARLALKVEGLWPSNEARAAVAKLPARRNRVEGAVALRKNTDNEASLAAASSSKVAAQATLCNGVEPDEEAIRRRPGRAQRQG